MRQKLEKAESFENNWDHCFIEPEKAMTIRNFNAVGKGAVLQISYYFYIQTNSLA